jgi:opacity protein-like surface antigen
MRSLIMTAALVLVCGSVASAQTRFGIQGSFGDDADFGIGARVRVPVVSISPAFAVIGSFDYFFPDGPVDYWEINANASYTIPGVRGNIMPYAGGGLNIAHASVSGFSNTDAGLNLMGGLNFRTSGRLMPYAEIRVELGGGEQFVLTGGLYF